jgi:hypothetical protein
MIQKAKNVANTIYKLKEDATRANIYHSELVLRTILMHDKYKSDKHLARFSFKSFSQFGEDGLLIEIFNRIGTTNKFFVEFGVGDGLENNTAHQLVVSDWSGLWIEGSASFSETIGKKFSSYIDRRKLTLINSFITAENIESLFKQGNVPGSFDLLSIDIDGNDYHIWEALNAFSPRVVVVEYNASYGPRVDKVSPYNPSFVWDGTNKFGSSLKAFERLGNQKGYSLVGCDVAGINAFFVRTDLVGDHFYAPFTSEIHFEPPRYFLNYFGGHTNNRHWWTRRKSSCRETGPEWMRGVWNYQEGSL